MLKPSPPWALGQSVRIKTTLSRGRVSTITVDSFGEWYLVDCGKADVPLYAGWYRGGELEATDHA